MKSVVPFLKQISRDPDWLLRVESSSLGYVLFKNGYHDGLVFYDKETHGFNPDIFFTTRLDIDHTVCMADEEKAYVQDAKQRLFYNAIGSHDVAAWFILNVARALMGGAFDMKRILFCLGQSNCGKTTICTAITNSLGQYVGSFDAHSLAVQKNKSADQAQNQRWLLALCRCRSILSSELDVKTTVCEHKLKIAAIGGDSLVVLLHYRTEQRFKPTFVPFICANDMPQIVPFHDAQSNRARFMNFNIVFVRGEPKNNTELKMDPNIHREMNTTLFKTAFINMIMDAYKTYRVQYDLNGLEPIGPEEIIVAKQIWVAEDSQKKKQWRSS